MDHHCFFIGKCVGIGNQKNFILFLIYTMIFSFIMGLLIIKSVYLRGKESFLQFFFFVEIFFFLLNIGTIFLCWTYFIDQLKSLQENQTLVEFHQHKRGKPVNSSKSFLII